MVKRSTTYYRRRPYQSRAGLARSVMRTQQRINRKIEPYGVQSTERYMKYGPNRDQMLADDTLSRSADQNINRYVDRYYGPGDYRSALRNVGKWGSRIGGAAIGATRGYLTGGPQAGVTGAQSGWNDGANFSKLVGWGDYNTPSVANQIVSRGPSNAQSPVMVNDLGGDVTMSHREFIGNIVVTGSAGGVSPFEIRTFELNPGIVKTFPFLSQIASNFEMYTFFGLAFQFVPQYGESSSVSNNLGKVIMATNYDPSAPVFDNSVQMQNYDYANSCKPSLGQVHGVETDTSKRATDQLYVRNGTSPKDLIFTDLGKFQVATEGIPLGGTSTSAIVGELWVSYQVTFSRAKLGDVYDGVPHDVYYFVANGTTMVNNIEVSSKNSGISTLIQDGSNVNGAVMTFPEMLQGKVYAITLRVNEATPSAAVAFKCFSVSGLEFIQVRNFSGPSNTFTADKTATATQGLSISYVRALASTSVRQLTLRGTLIADAILLGMQYIVTVQEVSTDFADADFI